MLSTMPGKEIDMRRFLLGSLLCPMLLASLAAAAPGGAPAAPLPALDGSSPGSATCDEARPALQVPNPLDGVLFLSPPQGCSSICSGANGKPCSPEGAVKSCFDVNEPEYCQVCTCTASLAWACPS